jgi:hypothetical protein
MVGLACSMLGEAWEMYTNFFLEYKKGRGNFENQDLERKMLENIL